MDLHITSTFDSGNIRVEEVAGTHARLSIRKDNASDFYQWFHFRVHAEVGQPITLDVTGLNDSAYPGGWTNYNAATSSDREQWTRAESTFLPDENGGTLRISHTPTTTVTTFAYFAPYSFERHLDLVAMAASDPRVTHSQIGVTLDGRPIDKLQLGRGERQLWIYARQHPGESMAEWFAEGALCAFLDDSNPHARRLLEAATVHLVPNCNPDGSVRGHLRTNAAGVNLNRVWHAPDADKSPEILAVRNAMDESGVDYAIDVHGDEAIAGVFLAGFEGIPDLDPNKQAEFDAIKAALDAQTADFQTRQGYPTAAPGKANMTMSTNQVAHRYQAVSMTLEMPFKDHDDNADPEHGWSPERCMRLAEDFIAVLARHLQR